MITPLSIEKMQQAIINNTDMPMGEAVAQEAQRDTLRQVKKRLIEIDCRLNPKERDSGIAGFIAELEREIDNERNQSN